MKEKIFNQYAHAIASHFNVTVEEICGFGIEREITPLRHMLYLLCDDRKMSASEIARYMRNKGASTIHTSVIRGQGSIKRIMKMDIDYARAFSQIKNSVS